MSSPHRSHPISRIPLFLLLALLQIIALFVLAYAPITWLREWFSLGSGLLGIGYGGIFTLAPTVVSVVWGIGGFGRNWGILTFSPGTLLPLPLLRFVLHYLLIVALGAIIFGLLYARDYDLHSPAPPAVCLGRECWKSTILSAAWSGLIAITLLWYIWRRNWERRGWLV